MSISTVRVVPVSLFFHGLYRVEVDFLVLYPPQYIDFTFLLPVSYIWKSVFSFCTHHVSTTYRSHIDFTFLLSVSYLSRLFSFFYPVRYVYIYHRKSNRFSLFSCLCRIISKSAYLDLYPITLCNVSATGFSVTICLRRDQSGRRGPNVSTYNDSYRTRTINFHFSTVLVRYPPSPCVTSPRRVLLLNFPTKHLNQNLSSLSPLFLFLTRTRVGVLGVFVFAG